MRNATDLRDSKIDANAVIQASERDESAKANESLSSKRGNNANRLPYDWNIFRSISEKIEKARESAGLVKTNDGVNQ
jgi:hypothetical protein